MTAIHQFVPTLAPRDAVSIHYLAVQRALLDAGYRSEIYAYEAKEELRKQARPYREFTGGSEAEPTWIMYHSSVGSPVADFVAERPEPLIIDYHNITPASFFQAWEPSVVGVLNLGRRQLARLAPRATLGLADSTFNARNWHGSEHRRRTSCRSCSTSPASTAPLIPRSWPASRRRARAVAPTGSSSAGSRRTRPSTTS